MTTAVRSRERNRDGHGRCGRGGLVMHLDGFAPPAAGVPARDSHSNRVRLAESTTPVGGSRRRIPQRRAQARWWGAPFLWRARLMNVERAEPAGRTVSVWTFHVERPHEAGTGDCPRTPGSRAAKLRTLSKPATTLKPIAASPLVRAARRNPAPAGQTLRLWVLSNGGQRISRYRPRRHASARAERHEPALH